MKKQFSIFAMTVFLLAGSSLGQVNLTPAQLFPPGDTAWTLDTLGINGTVAFKLLVEHSGSGAQNSFRFDSPANGFPGTIGTSTDDLVVFAGADVPGKIATLAVPAGANLSLFHDITDVTGIFGSGPDGVLNTNDAYLNSNPTLNYTRVGPDQLIKYYGADPFTTYTFTAFDQTVNLGSGFIAFIFIEEDHTPNYDYNDMVIGVLPSCEKNEDCDDGLNCNGVEHCAFGISALTGGVCIGGTPPVCTDNVDCTFDECREEPNGHSCLYKPHDQDCDDKNFCNGEEVCDAILGCMPGKPVNCDDGIACTEDICIDKGACINSPKNDLCSDGDACNGVEVCSRKKGCLAGTPVVCNDGVVCTDDVCDPQTGTCQYVVDDSCDDGNACNGVETCDPVNGCQAGPPPNCDDGLPCTTDSCNPQTGACSHAPDHSLCNNGLFCDGDETCSPVTGCVPGTPPDCNDSISCTVDTCDEADNVCLHTPNPAACLDGLYCNGVETCDPLLGCQAGPPPVCIDAVGCTVDTCDEATDSCVYTPNPALCSDGQFCNGIETCDPVMGCQDGPDPVCDDAVTCTTNLCNPLLNACEYVPDNSLCNNGLYCDGVEVCDPVLDCLEGSDVICNDEVDCTTDECDETLDACVYTPHDEQCDDGLFCNGPEVCGSSCEPGVSPCKPGESCNEELDTCTLIECVLDGDCPIASFCEGPASCIDGECEYAPPSCNDNIPCTLDRCDAKLGACVNTPDDSLCTNGLYCDGAEVCNPQTGCTPGIPVDCNDNVPCTTDVCVEATDQCTHTPGDTFCNDGLFCNGTEVCHPTQGCLPGTPPNCIDGSNCTVDTCNEASDQCDHTCSTPQITCTDQQFECDDVGTFLPPVVDDPCSVNPVATCIDVTTPGKLPQESNVTRTCSFTNDCGNSASCVQVVRIRDTTPPDVQCPPDRVFECDGLGDPGQPVVSDNCDPDPEVTVEVEEIIGDCTPPTTAGITPPPKLIRLNTYTVTDGGASLAEGQTADGDTTGNTAICVQRIEIVDTHGPIVVSCPSQVNGCVGLPLEFEPPTCNDTCGPCTVTCTRSDGQPLGDLVPADPLTIRCVATDECESSSDPCDVTVTISECEDIPTVSQWGLVILTLLLLIGAKLRFTRSLFFPV